MRSFFEWLFSSPDGHFGLIVIALAIAALAWLCVFLKSGPGPATPIAVAVGVLFQSFIQKTR